MDREIDIRQYWTRVVRGIGEFDAVAKAENPEFNSLAECLTRLLNDTFVTSATETGVERFEDILNIVPTAEETIEDRKIKILTYLNVKLPYTWTMLYNTLDAIFEGNFTMSLNNQTYTLRLEAVFTSLNHKKDVVELLNGVLPKNLIIEVIEK